MTGTPTRIAVIGAGSIGRRHAANLVHLGVPVELIGWREFSSGERQLPSGLDGLVIATSTSIRRVLIELCIENDLPFYVEKPLGWSLEEVTALHEIAAPVAERSLIGFMMRYHLALRDVACTMPASVYNFSMEIGHDVRQWRENWSFAGSYAAEPEGGGVLLDLCHELDMALALFPDLELSRCDSLGHSDFPGVDMASSVAASSPGGLMGRISMDYLSPVSIRKTILRGLDHHIDINFLEPSITRMTPDGERTQHYTFERNDMFLDAMRDFLALVQGKPTSRNPLMPRFDRMARSSRFIAKAWEERQFTGTVEFDLR